MVRLIQQKNERTNTQRKKKESNNNKTQVRNNTKRMSSVEEGTTTRPLTVAVGGPETLSTSAPQPVAESPASPSSAPTARSSAALHMLGAPGSSPTQKLLREEELQHFVENVVQGRAPLAHTVDPSEISEMTTRLGLFSLFLFLLV